ncbi:ead/Ea22-like family protein [Klebsiella grimontii]|uniref:ead/Ea22-like family protein n=1 Tax=Klebsiella grimontii TaxID=2058152 RepID=UPI0012B6AF04|nr:ead/Ea22-like family protein [Klebsiella grimontii]
MTITLQAVNELIQSLESAGELSIKEQKYLELAKAYQQLAAENVGMKGALTGSAYISFIKANGWNTSASTVNGKFVNFADPEVDFGSMVFAHAKKLIEAVETPATDRIVAGIKADGRIEGAHFVANRMLAAWDAGFIDDTAKNAADIARMILTSTEFMADAPEGDFDRSFADGILEDIAQQLREGADK